MMLLRVQCLLTTCAVLTLSGAAFAAKPAPTKADVAYGPHPHQLMDIYVPPQGDGPFPVLLWFGGLWEASKHVPDVNRFFPAGVAVIGVEMRVMKEAADEKVFPPVAICMLDARRAVQYVRLHASEWKLDPARIAVAGGSQGSLPALYLGSAGERADLNSTDPVERVSTKVTCVGAFRSQPTIDPKLMQDWVPGVQWGAPSLGCSFPESLRRRDELLPLINEWSPDALLNKDSAPIYFENEWGLTQPEDPKITEANYKTHCPQWALGYQKIATERGATCYVKYLGHPSEKYADIWEFLVRELTANAN